MTQTNEQLLQVVRDALAEECPECIAGKCNDAGLGDISFNEWDCQTCNGTGSVYPQEALSALAELEARLACLDDGPGVEDGPWADGWKERTGEQE